MNYPVAITRSNNFLSQVRHIKPLTPEQEYELAVKYRESGDLEAAHELVVSHLPFVVKVAFQYRHYMIPVQDLIQEGTIGLMKAVKRFDPYKGFRLVSFAVWWIKAYIKNYILKSWNLVKLGTTQAQRKLFFPNGRHRRAYGSGVQGTNGFRSWQKSSRSKRDDVIEMEARVKARDWSLNETVGDEGDLSGIDMLVDDSESQEKMLIDMETETEISTMTKKALKKLDPRERFIITKRFLDDSDGRFRNSVNTSEQVANEYGSLKRVR